MRQVLCVLLALAGSSCSGSEALESYEGEFVEGLQEVARLSEAGAPEEALALTARLLAPTRTAAARSNLAERTRGISEFVFEPLGGALDWLGFETRSQREQAEVHYARGVLHTKSGEEEAALAFGLARELAGGGKTRSDAIYNLGTLELLAGEAERAKIPEISGEPPVAPAPPQPGQAGPEDEPDPLELARARYLAAREHYVERLRVDWRDADVRANTELVMRRLKELEEIERQRQEQQQEEQQEDQQQEQDPNQQKQEPSEEDQSQEEQEQPEEPSEEDPESNEEPEERELTDEEMQRLLQRLEDLEKQLEEMREAQRRAGAQRVRRDW